MASRQFRMHGGKKGAALAIRVTPRASKNEIIGILDDGTIKIRLTAPPVEGKANAELIRFLAKVLDIAPNKLEIVAGETGRDKLVTVLDLDPEMVHSRVLRHLS